MMKIYLIILAVLAGGVSSAQLVYSEGQYMVDTINNLILVNRPPGPLDPDEKSIQLDKKYVFNSDSELPETGRSYEVSSGADLYRLYFTDLPIINISIPDTPNRETEVLGTVLISDPLDTISVSNMGIRIRGASSATYPKKSYRVQIKNESGSNMDTSFFGLREDKRWLLLAMWNERLRINNIMSHRLWSDIHTLYYANEEPEAQPAIRLLYTEVFINSEYRGVYLFTEDMDRKQLKIKKEKDGVVRGELYKGDQWGGANTFDSLPPAPGPGREVWGGWELKYPDESDWSNLYEFTDFVMHSNPEDFTSEIGNRLNLDNAVDYFIFLNITRAEDNTGKNLFLARYDKDSPYFFAPWDLDGTWGYYFTGVQNVIHTGILSNGLFNRLLTLNPEEFRERLSERWFALRENVLSSASLIGKVAEYHGRLKSNGVYEREQALWNTSVAYDLSELNYISMWIQNRLAYLDAYFKDVEVSTSHISINEAHIQIFPNPATSSVNVSITDSYKTTSRFSAHIQTITGKEIIRNIIQYGWAQLNIEDLPAGVYIISIRQDDKIIRTEKFVKM